jgi:hypothetical protein
MEWPPNIEMTKNVQKIEKIERSDTPTVYTCN